MRIREAKELLNRQATIVWVDRHGSQRRELVLVWGVHFEPMYGHYLETDHGDIALDHIEHFRLPPAANATGGPRAPQRPGGAPSPG